MADIKALEDKVNKFKTLQLPGQPMLMHMGTLYLVNDLWCEVQRLRQEVDLQNDLVAGYKNLLK